MKFVIALFILFTHVGSTCHKAASTSNCYKARLEIKGICMNYVIKVLDGDLSKLQLEKEWKDESDGKVYQNVFALASRCNFPDLNEGETFYFTVADKTDESCNVCMAYRPVPAVKNNIVVSKTPCP